MNNNTQQQPMVPFGNFPGSSSTLLPIPQQPPSILYKYRFAPKNATSFTKLEIDTGKSQDVDITTLKEPALHMTLWLFKKKVDPQQLLSIRGLLDNLPDVKQPTYDPDLAKKVPAERLRAMLLDFMKAWYTSTLPQRGVNPDGNVGNIRSQLFSPGWSPLHTVTSDPKTSVNNTAVCTTANGTEISSARCRESYQQVLRRIRELNDFLERCEATNPLSMPQCYGNAKAATQAILQTAPSNC